MICLRKASHFTGTSAPDWLSVVRAAAEAQRRLGVERSGDEEIVCISENDACGVDGIQVILGCTAGKGNLRFRLTGKHAYTFYNRTTQRAIRFVLRDLPKMASREEKQKYILHAPFEQIFQVTPPSRGMPPEAPLFSSVNCEVCGESTAEPFIRLREGKKLCGDCLRNESPEGSGRH